jgi:hypothetical protein
MPSDTRLFHRSDPDFPTTAILQQRLVAAGRVAGEGPLAPPAAAGKVASASPVRRGLRPTSPPKGRSPAALAPAQMAPPPASIPLGETDGGTLHLDLRRLLAGRCLIQGSSGAGKSATLRHLVEQAQDFLTIIIIDPEGEFGNLAAHVGAATLRAADIAGDGLTAAALRARQHRLPLHLDLTDLAPDDRISKAAAFNAGLLAAPREHWAHTVLVVIDEAHLLAPHLAASARDAETRRLGVATLTELCARGRKRGICPVIATQRLAKLATSVVSELHNVLLGLNVFDRDVARAGDLLGFGADKAAALRTLEPGAFYALGPALCATPRIVRITPSITSHTGATPDLVASANLSIADAQRLLELDALRETGQPGPQPSSGRGNLRALDSFLLDDNAAAAARVVAALRAISPNATTAAELQQHLALDASSTDAALDLLTSAGAIDTVPRGAARIARLSARLRLRAFDTPVVRLA